MPYVPGVRRRAATLAGPAAGAFLWAFGLFLLAACSDTTQRRPLVVFAASSLAEAFEDLEHSFERAHPRVDLRLVFAGSQVLRLQIEHGAAAHLFASADESHIDALQSAKLLTRSEVFAQNELVVITPTGDETVQGLDSLDRSERLVVGTDGSPIGAYTRQLFTKAAQRLGSEHVARIRARIVSEESNARLVRAKVELGEADAAIVYRTDALASSRVRSVMVPRAVNVRATYRIGLLRGAPPAATEFVRHLRSGEGRTTLERHGFLVEEP